MGLKSGRERVPGPEVLLCERCGYVLDGTPRDGVCAECGKPAVESLPERRVGSAWQRRPGLKSFAEVVLMMHARPRAVWNTLATSRADISLCRAGGLVLGASAACLVLAIWLLRLRAPGAVLDWSAFVRSGRMLQAFAHGDGMPLLVGGVVWLAVFFSVFALTWIEARGVMFFSRQRGWRVPKKLAWAICAHASVTWWIAGAGVLIGVALRSWVVGSFPAGMAGANVSLFQNWIREASAFFPVAGFVVGMLVFETLVYQGVRACKFANARDVNAGKARDAG